MSPTDEQIEPPSAAEGGDDREDAEGGEAAVDASGEPRKRRRRRRRREPGADAPPAEANAAAGAAAPARAAPARAEPARVEPTRERREYRGGRSERSGQERPRAEQPRGEQSRAEQPRAEQPRGELPRGGENRRARSNEPRSNEPRSNEPRSNEPRSNEPRGERARNREGREARGGEHRNEPNRGREPRENRSEPNRGREPRDRGELSPERSQLPAAIHEAPTQRLDARRPAPSLDDPEHDAPAAPAVAWGKDDEGPPPAVALVADLPAEPPVDDPEPLTQPLLDQPSASLGDDVASITGVRFVPGGRIQWLDAGDADYARGERVLVDAERGTRLAWIAVPPARKPIRERGMRRVIRRANDQDLRGERDSDADRNEALRIAKDKAAALRLPLKVFRVDVLGALGRGGRLNVYYTSDERLDLRDFLRDVSSATGGARIELRQLGVRDEAKAVGGIGSCGLTLCCTTWLPDFVPVSIKMAKDQGLVLSPTKVSGQCGRLKCCLVYEQAAYAELRKGLPKLGKRVVGARGEGRVVEVDVLRQRIRVSYGPGDTEVVGATDVKPLFPSGNQPSQRDRDAAHDDDSIDTSAETADGGSDPALHAIPDHAADDDALPDDDPSSAP